MPKENNKVTMFNMTEDIQREKICLWSQAIKTIILIIYVAR